MADEQPKPSELEAFLSEVHSRPAPQVTFNLRVALDPARHRPTGGTQHFYGSPLEPEKQVPVPIPAALRIVQYDSEDAFYLLYLDADGNELTDTWHASLDDAKEQARSEFQVAPTEWRESND